MLGLVLSLCAPAAGLAPSAHPAAGASGGAPFGLAPSPHPAASTIDGTATGPRPLRTRARVTAETVQLAQWCR